MLHSVSQIASQQSVAVDVVVEEAKREVVGVEAEAVMEGEEEEVIKRILLGVEVVVVEVVAPVVEADLAVDEVCISLYILHHIHVACEPELLSNFLDQHE